MSAELIAKNGFGERMRLFLQEIDSILRQNSVLFVANVSKLVFTGFVKDAKNSHSMFTTLQTLRVAD